MMDELFSTLWGWAIVVVLFPFFVYIGARVGTLGVMLSKDQVEQMRRQKEQEHGRV